MSYSSNDLSVSSGKPIEVYKWVGPFGTYRFTNDNESHTVNGELYEPIVGGISRTSAEISSVIDSAVTVNITIPSNSTMALLYAFGETPQSLTVEVRRAHRGDDLATEWRLEWLGKCLGFETENNKTTIKTGSILQEALNGNLSSVFYQRLCNHTLYDSRCKVVRATFTAAAAIVKVQAQYLTVDDDGNVNNALRGGKVVLPRTGERRAIVSNVDNLLRIDRAFIDIVVGDSVELELGCDHLRLGDCKLRFNNVANYGGFDFVPVTNPFESKV